MVRTKLSSGLRHLFIFNRFVGCGLQTRRQDAARCLQEIREYNKAVRTDIPYNMAVKDGRCTVGLRINKSNWANTIEEPPFEAYQVGCGVSFSFGGAQRRCRRRADRDRGSRD